MVIYRKNRYIIITPQLIPKLILQFKKMKKMKNKNSNKQKIMIKLINYKKYNK